MNIEKNNIETYYYDKKAHSKDQKNVEINDYYLSNLNFTNNLYKKIQNKIIKESESIYETPRRDLDFEYTELENQKTLFFQRKLSHYDETVKNFQKLLEEIYTIFSELNKLNDKKNAEKFLELYQSTKLALSTCHLFNKNYETGLQLIKELIEDYPNYLRAHIKRLEVYHRLANYEQGIKEYEIIKNWTLPVNEKDKDYMQKTINAFHEDYKKHEEVIYLI